MIKRYDSYEAYRKHPIYRIIRQVALRQANYRCACGEKATEVHHIRYPKPNGTAFDTPGNLKPVCYACHCKLEGKPS